MSIKSTLFFKLNLVYYGMNKIFTNPKQLEEWVEVAKGIQNRYGTDKALGYVIGEKFYNLVAILYSARKIMWAIDGERKKPDYNPVRVAKYKDSEIATNLDETYEDERARIMEAEGLLIKFVFLISQAFSPYEIRKYFESHPPLGANSHISTEEEHDFLISIGAVEHSIEIEAEDALIFGDMMKYFGIS
jgi:hypothetical protein